MSTDRVMLLIDADNVSVDVMEQAVRLLMNQHGALHVRRAYCTAESAVANQGVFKRLGIKPMVNLAAGKNSTDIAMAVDAIDLVLAERPDVVVICSSDSDFAPLVHRLREKGCVVRGIGQKGKTGDETQDVYDDYTVLEHRKASAGELARAAAADAPKRTRTPRKSTAAKVPAAKKAPAARKAPAAKKTSARTAAKAVSETVAETAADAAVETTAGTSTGTAGKTTARGAARKRVARKAAAAPAAVDLAPADVEAAERPSPEPASPAPERVTPASAAPAASHAPARHPLHSRADRGQTSLQAVLACLPELQAGQGLALNVAVQRLREAQLLGKNSSSLKLFSQLSDRFELVPADKPSQVRLRA